MELHLYARDQEERCGKTAKIFIHIVGSCKDTYRCINICICLLCGKVAGRYPYSLYTVRNNCYYEEEEVRV